MVSVLTPRAHVEFPRGEVASMKTLLVCRSPLPGTGAGGAMSRLRIRLAKVLPLIGGTVVPRQAWVAVLRT
ncbi:hypothetical protein SAMN02787144_10663 [Streptomyces atratus]|uniref:Uncharacterized protein n=1 Tax=Streptomyces atratus TaxID=1893 RepID=A0A1K2FBU6_STRAR|nr:hypothetical protein SAMN02787144_10663 [Streptomyces atratus]